MKKLLFFDLDGTLAVDNEPPSPRVAEALRAARRKGHKIFLCTARTSCDLYKSILDLGFDGIVAGAGAQVTVAGREIFHHFIPMDRLIRTVEGILRNGFSGVLEGTDNIYRVPGEIKLNGPWPMLRAAEDVVPEMKIEKFTIHTADPSHIRRITARMPELLEWYDLYENNDGSFGEFVCKGVTKASGIRRVMDFLGAGRDCVVAFGDSRNDAPALRLAGTGVAMGNAPEELKEIASFVTGTVDNDGVAVALIQQKIID